MKVMTKTLLVTALLVNCTISNAQQRKGYTAIYSGVPWFDNNGNVVSSHGASIIKDKGRYYLFGERHTDTSNAFAGFTCYSSNDLYNWKFESMALPVQPTGKLGPNRVGERVKVMRCPGTGEYVMFMHVDSTDYKDQFTGYATSGNITGPYLFQGPCSSTANPPGNGTWALSRIGTEAVMCCCMGVIFTSSAMITKASPCT